MRFNYHVHTDIDLKRKHGRGRDLRMHVLVCLVGTIFRGPWTAMSPTGVTRISKPMRRDQRLQGATMSRREGVWMVRSLLGAA